jgi:hypothetical protein
VSTSQVIKGTEQPINAGILVKYSLVKIVVNMNSKELLDYPIHEEEEEEEEEPPIDLGLCFFFTCFFLIIFILAIYLKTQRIRY